MASTAADDFFPPLRRRLKYSMKRSGGFYHYQRYRREITEDCLFRCVFCDSHEREIGGETSMDLDHFRPKSRKEFKHLINDPRNLIYACKSCNGLKSDWWPAGRRKATFIGEEGFLEPFGIDRRDYFAIGKEGAIRGKRPPARYMITLLALDRPFLRRIRELRTLKRDLAKLGTGLKHQAELVLSGSWSSDPKAVSKIAMEVVQMIQRLVD
ncbi:MAG TPA: HNH endonuclease signature motif containing protein [Candidatus Saccharimonadales bacterium]|nr:HNH endonuclease signature motif containing protein [Candidatus Saccharimonadales bacterium]